MAKLLTWRASTPASGPYRSFQKRGWPTAVHTETGQPAATISCADDYSGRAIKTGQHAELQVRIAQHFHTKEERSKFGGFKWRTLSQPVKTLEEAKQAAEKALLERPDWLPKPEDKEL